MQKKSKLLREAMSLKGLHCHDLLICEILKIRDIKELHRMIAGQKMPSDVFTLDPLLGEPEYAKEREMVLLTTYGQWMLKEVTLTSSQIIAIEHDIELKKVKAAMIYYMHTLHMIAHRLPATSKNWLHLFHDIAHKDKAKKSVKIFSDLYKIMKSYHTKEGGVRERQQPASFPGTEQWLRQLIKDFSLELNDNHNLWSLIHEWYDHMIAHLTMVYDRQTIQLFTGWMIELMPSREERMPLILYYGLKSTLPLGLEELAKELGFISAQNKVQVLTARNALHKALNKMNTKENKQRLHDILFLLEQEEDHQLLFEKAVTNEKLREVYKHRQQLLRQPNCN